MVNGSSSELLKQFVDMLYLWKRCDFSMRAICDQ